MKETKMVETAGRMSHSDKGLLTLTKMGTEPEDWGLAEIVWKKEKRMLPVEKYCPTCKGGGKAWFKDGKHYSEDEAKKASGCGPEDRYFYMNDYSYGKLGATEGLCPACPPNKGHYRRFRGGGQHWIEPDKTRNSGRVSVLEEVEIMVGYPQWAKDTKFDSRFGCSNDCELCAKRLKKSGRVPVTGKGADGKIHGMWTGEDCAKKFFGIKNFKKKDAIIEEVKA